MKSNWSRFAGIDPDRRSFRKRPFAKTNSANSRAFNYLHLSLETESTPQAGVIAATKGSWKWWQERREQKPEDIDLARFIAGLVAGGRSDCEGFSEKGADL